MIAVKTHMEIDVNKQVPKNRNANINNQLVSRDDKFNTSIMDETIFHDEKFYIELPDKQSQCYINFNDENTSLDALSKIGVGINNNNEEQFNNKELDSLDVQSVTVKKNIEIGNKGTLTIGSNIIKEEKTDVENLKATYQQLIISNNKFQMSPYGSMEIEYKEKALDKKNTLTEVNTHLETGISTKFIQSDNLILDVSADAKFTVPFAKDPVPEFNSINNNIRLQYNPKYDVHIGLSEQASIYDSENNTKSIGLNVKQDNILGNSANLKALYSDSIESKNDLKTISRSLIFSGDLVRQFDKNTKFNLSGQYKMTQEKEVYIGRVLSDLTSHSLSTNSSLNKQLSEKNSLKIETSYSMNVLKIGENNQISQSINARAEIKNENKVISSEVNIPLDNPQNFSNTISYKFKF